MEILLDRSYTLGTNFSYAESINECDESNISRQEIEQHYHPIETVWGGGGEKTMNSMESNTSFHFEKISRTNVRSSWANGQIPMIYFL